MSAIVTEPNSLPSSLAFAFSEQTTPAIASAFIPIHFLVAFIIFNVLSFF
jgi:hypothetical protein